MLEAASELSQRLAQSAEAVCRHYLSNGRRQGHYWLVGNVRNEPGRSMFVRLCGPVSGPGAAGRWTDSATGEHGDLLDLIRQRCGLHGFRDLADEVRRFFALPQPVAAPDPNSLPKNSQSSTPQAARRLLAITQPIQGTLAEAYLRNRGITYLDHTEALRFLPRCYYKPDEKSPTQIWPAMIARVTDLNGRASGAHRTWLDPDGFDPVRLGKAPVENPRRAMGDLLGHAVRFGKNEDVLAAGEGIETVLSVRCALPVLPTAAALTANHLAVMLFPATLRRLYIVRDIDTAGDMAFAALSERAAAAGIEALPLTPRLNDFNEDLRHLGLDELRATLRPQLTPEDGVRFLSGGADASKSRAMHV